MTLLFPQPLQEATVINRPNRFIVWAELNGQKIKCHCPVSGRIGGLTIDNLKVLVSGPYEGRGTAYSVEAVALEPKTSSTFQWIGLNQTRCNAVVEHLLTSGTLHSAFPEATAVNVKREKKLADSRIDFLVNNATFIEVKMPLLKIHAQQDANIPMKTFPAGNPSERLPKQMKAISDNIAHGYRGVLLTCFQYEHNSGTSAQAQMDENIFPDEALLAAKAKGLEHWKLTMALDELGISFRSLERY